MSDQYKTQALDVHSVLREAALDFIRLNAAAKPGDVVETLWTSWKQRRKVRIKDVGAHLVCRFDGDPGHGGDWIVGFAMNYTAERLRKDGSSAERYPGTAICLTNFTAADGKHWEQGGRWKQELGFNHIGLSWGDQRDRIQAWRLLEAA